MWLLVLACAARDPASSGTTDSDTAVDDTGDSATDSSESGPKDTAHTGDPETGETGETGTPPPPVPCGTLLGSEQLTGPGWESVYAGIATPDGGRVLAIYLSETTTFAVGTAYEVTLEADGSGEGVLLRLESDGSIRWLREVRSTGGAQITTLALTSDGGVVVAGAFAYDVDIAAGEPDHLTMEVEKGFYADPFVARFADDGALLWARHFSGEDDEWAVSVAVLSDDSIILAGRQNAEMLVSAGEPDEALLKVRSSPSWTGFVVAYDLYGGLLWTQQAETYGYTTVTAIAVEQATDEILVSGTAEAGEAIFGGGETTEVTIVADEPGSGFVARYGADGAFLGLVEAVHAPVADVEVASDGGLIAVGHFWTDAVFGAGEPHETTLTTLAATDAFVARFDPTGALEWVTPTVSELGTSWSAWQALALDTDGGFVVAGYSSASTVSLGETASGADLEFTAPRGFPDALAAHYDGTGAAVCGVQFGGRDADQAYVLWPLAEGGPYQVGAFFQENAVAAAGLPEEVHFTADGLADWVLLTYAF